MEILNQLLKLLGQHHPQWSVATPLRGLEPHEVKASTGFVDPEPVELNELLRQYDFQCCNLIPFLDLLRPHEFESRMHSQIEMYKEANEVFEGGFIGWTSSTLDSCKTDLSWREKWIPIGENNGDCAFVDLDPSEQGVFGQIVMTSEDGKYLSVLGSSVSHFLERICRAIEHGGYGDAYDSLYLGRIEKHVV